MNSNASNAFRVARDELLALSPAEQRTSFKFPRDLEDFNWAHDWFDVIAKDNDRVALRIAEVGGADNSYTFAELSRRSNQVANWLLDQGVKPGAVLMLMLDNQIELWELMLAALKIGAVILPTSVVLGEHELADRVSRGKVSWVFASHVNAVKFNDIAGDWRGVLVHSAAADTLSPAAKKAANADFSEWLQYDDAGSAKDTPVAKLAAGKDHALQYFTSGTTSLPKIVVHDHISYPVGHLSTMAWIGVKPGDVHMVISAPGWGKHAWSSFFAPWHAEATIYVLNYARFDVDELVDRLDSAGVNTFCAPPTVWRMLIQHELRVKPHALREVISAGEPLNSEVISQIKRWWGLEIRDGYGQTETTALIGNLPGDRIVAGAMGRPLPGNSVILADPVTGDPLPESGEVEGEICLPLTSHPVNLMPGYLDNPEATAKATRGGLYHTGDVASRGADGLLTFVGRTDDVFKSSDFKVSPFEVESVLLEHPAVAEAAVVGAPDETRLNITKAYVAVTAGFAEDADTARAILAHAREALPPYMRVRRVEFFVLPKTTSGKIRRVELRQREEAAYSAGERIRTEWRESDFPDLKG